MDNNEKLLSASLGDIKRGYEEGPDFYTCLLCDEKVEKGVIYQEAGLMYQAEKYMKVHIQNTHGSVFEHLVGLGKKVTGISDHQSSLLKLFYQEKSDAEIQAETGIGSSSTIRNHRFVLKEKERQAKIFLVLMELLKGKDKKLSGRVSPHSAARMVDDRYNITLDESEEILKKFFPHGTKGLLKTFNMKEKSKLVVLREIIKRFEANRIYNEKEVNEILKTAYEDFATLRRYMIEYGFMNRTPDCSKYWLNEDVGAKGGEDMERRRELKQQYKEMKGEAGVYQIKNTRNGKALVISTPNLRTINGKRFELQMGGNKNKQLQEEWKLFGEESFTFEVLEVLEEKEGEFYNKRDELKKLEEKWLQKLQPYGDRGYNTRKASK